MEKEGEKSLCAYTFIYFRIVRLLNCSFVQHETMVHMSLVLFAFWTLLSLAGYLLLTSLGLGKDLGLG